MRLCPTVGGRTDGGQVSNGRSDRFAHLKGSALEIALLQEAEGSGSGLLMAAGVVAPGLCIAALDLLLAPDGLTATLRSLSPPGR